MQQEWRWFGEDDPLALDELRRRGAFSVATTLDPLPSGRAFSEAAIRRRQEMIEAAGLRWTLCERMPVPNAIKRGGTLGGRKARFAIDGVKDMLARLGRAGVRAVSYDFTPAPESATGEPLRGGGALVRAVPCFDALAFDAVDFIACDVFLLERPFASDCHDPEDVARAQRRLKAMSAATKTRLWQAGTGNLSGIDRETVDALLEQFAGVDTAVLLENLKTFLDAVLPVARDVGIRLAIEPDDPPFPLFGLPRVVSTMADVRAILALDESPAHGLAFRAAAFGMRRDNDLPAMAREFRRRIVVAELAGAGPEPDAVAEILMRETRRRRAAQPLLHMAPPITPSPSGLEQGAPHDTPLGDTLAA